MSKPVIGHIIKNNKAFHIDISTLLKTRLLIQANSGGGKSYALRKIIEETHGKYQQIILDIEDDFSTLREKYDFILAGAGGDIAVDPRTAELFAHKILELHADVIVNLYELKPQDRLLFVKLFLQAMVNAPKSLWHPTFVYLDEAHLFAPEGKKSESLEAVADMESRGRKRGFCLITSTQRLAKLDKDVAAECRNKIIGLANMEIDRKRAAEELGLTDREMVLSLRDLEEGEFYAVGPAFERGVTKIKIGEVKTTHHEAGEVAKHHKRPMPTSKIQKILAKLTDLPKEAEQELHDKQAMTKKINELTRELAATKREIKVETKIEKIVDPKAIKQAQDEFKIEFMKEFQKADALLEEAFSDFRNSVRKSFSDVRDRLHNAPKVPRRPFIQQPEGHVTVNAREHVQHVMDKLRQANTTDGKFGRCERAILKFLAMREGTAFTKVQIGAMTLYRPGSGGFNNALSKLSQSNFILRNDDQISINSEMISQVQELLGPEYTAPEPNALIGWLSKLGKCERVIFETLQKDSAAFYTKDELGSLTGYSSGSGGFNNAISRLSTLGLIQRNSDGTIALNNEILGV